MIRRFFVVACLVVLVSFPATIASAKPFKATLTGNANLSPTPDPTVFRNDETGVGNATHLGKFIWTDIEYADFDEIPGGISVVATFTMTAANGDKVLGTFTSVGVFADAVTLVIHGTYQVVDGTGRFAGASGTGDIDAIALLAPGLPFSGTLKGTLNY